MADARAIATARLLRARATARRGLLASATATVAIAVATVCALLAWLVVAVQRAGDAAPPGVPQDEVDAQVEDGVIALVSAAPALVLLVVIVAATAAAQLARLLAAAREQETANLRARGLSRGQASTANGIESAAVGVMGAIVGVALAALLLLIVNRGVAELVSLWWVAVVTAAILASVMVVASRPRSRVAARGARVTTVAAVVVVVLGRRVRPLAAATRAPHGFRPCRRGRAHRRADGGRARRARGVRRGCRRMGDSGRSAPGLAPAYPARQVARRLPIYAVAVLLVALTVAQAVFASAYSSTWTATVTDSAALRAGADLRVDLEPAAATSAIVTDAASVDGVDAAAPALVVPIEIGSTNAQLIAVPTEAIGTVVSAAGGIVDRRALAAAVEPVGGSAAADPISLGPAATGLRATASIDASRANVAESVVLTATVLDANGASASLRLEGASVDQPDGTATLTAEAPFPEGTAPWRLLAMTASIPASFANATVDVALVSAEGIGGDELGIDGAVVLDQSAAEQVVWLADGAEAGDGAEDDAADPPAVRAVLSTALAERIGLEVGDELEFRYAGTGRRGALLVADIVDAVPGAATGLAVFAPLEVLEVSMLQRGTSIVEPTSVWAAGAPSADVALSAALDDRPVATSAPGVAATIVGALVGGWWIATAGSVLLSLVAAFAIAQTLALARRRELGVLRALGVPHRRQARMRAGELSAVLGASVALGLLAGGLVSWLLVPDLVRAVTPGILSLGTAVSFAWPGLVVAILVLSAGLAAIVIATAARVRTAARAATVGEDAR